MYLKPFYADILILLFLKISLAFEVKQIAGDCQSVKPIGLLIPLQYQNQDGSLSISQLLRRFQESNFFNNLWHLSVYCTEQQAQFEFSILDDINQGSCDFSIGLQNVDDDDNIFTNDSLTDSELNIIKPPQVYIQHIFLDQDYRKQGFLRAFLHLLSIIVINFGYVDNQGTFNQLQLGFEAHSTSLDLLRSTQTYQYAGGIVWAKPGMCSHFRSEDEREFILYKFREYLIQRGIMGEDSISDKLEDIEYPAQLLSFQMNRYNAGIEFLKHVSWHGYIIPQQYLHGCNKDKF